jgi:hypothetical protein
MVGKRETQQEVAIFAMSIVSWRLYEVYKSLDIIDL